MRLKIGSYGPKASWPTLYAPMFNIAELNTPIQSTIESITKIFIPNCKPNQYISYKKLEKSTKEDKCDEKAKS